ncbi:hypothetical protein ACQKOE_13180 [Novosphingobium sp. NPDC080210]|uniref:hypothetical protein n=1 Tax=Novosphingobium sp. NPDC080210 TaxID=3390596 RepID=UPI003D02889E
MQYSAGIRGRSSSGKVNLFLEGGTDDCRTAASYYPSALRLFQAEGIDPDAIDPRLHEEYLRLVDFSAEGPDCTALGDLGPDLPTSDEARAHCPAPAVSLAHYGGGP